MSLREQIKRVEKSRVLHKATNITHPNITPISKGMNSPSHCLSQVTQVIYLHSKTISASLRILMVKVTSQNGQEGTNKTRISNLAEAYPVPVKVNITFTKRSQAISTINTLALCASLTIGKILIDPGSQHARSMERRLRS